MYFSALLPTDTAQLCDCSGCLGLQCTGCQDVWDCTWTLGLPCLSHHPGINSGPGKNAAETPGHWLGGSTNTSPFPAGSLDTGTAFQRPAELDGMVLSCSMLTGLRANKYWHCRAPCVNIGRCMKHQVSEMLFLVLGEQMFV